MCNPNYFNIAIERVISLDLPQHLIPMAIADQAKLLALVDRDSQLDDSWPLGPESWVTFL